MPIPLGTHNAADGIDEAFLAVVDDIEQAKSGYNVAQTAEAVQTLFNNLTTYLPAIEVIDSIDISFFLDDADFNNGVGWEGLPQLTSGQLRTTNTEVFNATCQLPVSMPKGVYAFVARGFQRPGAIAKAMKDYVEGNNNVQAYVTLNTTIKTKMKHIAEGGSETKLGQGGVETKYSGLYVPANNAANLAYIAAGRYDNMIRSEYNSSKKMTLGIRVINTVENDLIVVDDVKLFYYGNPNMTGIEEMEYENRENEIEGYYNINGIRITQPGRGITIVKYMDGHIRKILR